MGANAIWWFVGQFLTGNTHDPKDVFTRGRSRATSGDCPIYCITQNYDFSGNAHAILPWKWDKPNPWQVEIFDPNNATGTNTLIVNSSANTFSYNNNNIYSGGAWTGGRFLYMQVDGEFFLRKGGGVGASFNHQIRGKKAGKFEYALKNLSTGIHIESSIQPNETHDLSVKQMGLPSCSLHLNTSIEKSFKIQYVNYLGNVDDRIKVVMENVNNMSGQELRMVPKPGLAGIEIEGMKGTVKPKVVVEIRMDEKVTKQSFDIDAGKAVRMDFSRLVFSKELKVINMDRIGGVITSIKTYKSL